MEETDLFIQLTNMDGISVTFNVKHIVAIYPCEGATVVVVSTGDKFKVKEPYEAIYGILPYTASIEIESM